MTMTTSRAGVLAVVTICMTVLITHFIDNDGTVPLSTETFRIQHMDHNEVMGLIDAYVWGEREGAGGAMSFSEGAVTVRETHDNLRRIRETLAEFDRPREDVQLFFQLIEADGFTDNDPRIAEVEVELRKLFQFQGYRLAAEAAVTAADGTEIMQGMRSSDGLYEVSAHVRRTSSGQLRLADVNLHSSEGWALTTSVSLRAGQTIVLGSTPKGDSNATLFLTVRAEIPDSSSGSTM